MSDNTKKCLVVGLPNAGKSTFIGAFWAIEKDGGTGHTLTFEKYPSDRTYLNALKDKWLEQKTVDRTVQLSQDLVLDLMRSSDEKKLTVSIPDFKGEAFNQLLVGNSPEKLDNWIKESDSILLFVENCEEEIYSEEFGNDYEPEGETQLTEFNIGEVEPWIKVVQILKFIKKEKGNIPLSICISAWDKTLNEISEGDTIETWLKAEHLFFYRFTEEYFPGAKYFGISAQGLDYDNRGGLTEAKVGELTEKGKRAYISSGTDKDYDITKPLAWLLED